MLRTEKPIDLMITDYAMPGMTGLQLAEAARGLRPGLPILLATGHADLLVGAVPRPAAPVEALSPEAIGGADHGVDQARAIWRVTRHASRIEHQIKRYPIVWRPA